MMGALPPGTPVVYEDAGFHDASMRDVILEAIPTLATVHSLNEDEAQEYLGRQVDLTDPRDVGRMMTDLREQLRTQTVLVHTSHFAASIGEEAARTNTAAIDGNRMASTRFAHGDASTLEDYRSVGDADPDPIGKALARDEGLAACGVLVAPSRDVACENPTTIGLGDAFIGGVMMSMGCP